MTLSDFCYHRLAIHWRQYFGWLWKKVFRSAAVQGELQAHVEQTSIRLPQNGEGRWVHLNRPFSKRPLLKRSLGLSLNLHVFHHLFLYSTKTAARFESDPWPLLARLLRPTWLTENSLSLLCLGASATCMPLCVCMTTVNWHVNVSTTRQVQTVGNARRIIRAGLGVQAHTSLSLKAQQTPVSNFALLQHVPCMMNCFFLGSTYNYDFASFLFKMQQKSHSWFHHL